jgi:hypothetical protein
MLRFTPVQGAESRAYDGHSRSIRDHGVMFQSLRRSLGRAFGVSVFA